MKKLIASVIWNTSELTGIPLGRFAPIVLGWSMGRKSKEL